MHVTFKIGFAMQDKQYGTEGVFEIEKASIGCIMSFGDIIYWRGKIIEGIIYGEWTHIDVTFMDDE